MEYENFKVINGWFCTVENDNVIPFFGDIEIENGVIKDLEKRDFSSYTFARVNSGENVYDAGGRVVTLPLINFHDHIYSRLAKGLDIQGPTDNFENILKNLWWKLDLALDHNMTKASTEMTVMEALRNGVTTIFDHHASPSSTAGSLNVIAEVLGKYDMRGVLCFETSDRNGKEKTAEAITENKNFMGQKSFAEIRGMMGLHASFTVDDDTLRLSKEVIEATQGGIHIHLCEDKADTRISIEKYGVSPLERLEANGLLNSRSILSHAIHLGKNDYRKIAEYGSAIACNPDSNLNNSVGVPVFSDIPAEVPLLPGTDGMHDAIARTMKQLFLLHRYQGNGFEITFPWFIKMYFDQLNFVRKYFPDFPSLAKGDKADFVVWDYVPAAPFDEGNFWGHYIYGILERPVVSVVNKGKFLMKDFKITVMDEATVNAEIYRQGVRLKEAFANMQ